MHAAKELHRLFENFILPHLGKCLDHQSIPKVSRAIASPDENDCLCRMDLFELHLLHLGGCQIDEPASYVHSFTVAKSQSPKGVLGYISILAWRGHRSREAG